MLAGLVTACRFAICPTSFSPEFENATIDGVVREPSALAMICVSPFSNSATQEFVVPRSMPMTLPMPCGPRRSPSGHQPAESPPPLRPDPSAALATMTRAGRTRRSRSWNPFCKTSITVLGGTAPLSTCAIASWSEGSNGFPRASISVDVVLLEDREKLPLHQLDALQKAL